MRRFGLGGPVRLRLHGFPSVEQPALRAIQLIVCFALIGFDAGDRLPRLVLTGVLRPLLFFGRTPLDRNLLALATDALRCFFRGADLKLVADRRLFLTVLFALQRCRR